MQLEIHPASESSPGGWRLPVRFTIRNTGDQPIHACLSGGRVIHLWELDRNFGYTLTQHQADQPGCEEPLDLPPHATHSWNEEITIPQIAAGSVRLVGFTQVVAAACAASGCEPSWLSASFSPFEIEEGEGPARQGQMLDMRTNLTSADLTSRSPIDPIEEVGPGGER